MKTNGIVLCVQQNVADTVSGVITAFIGSQQIGDMSPEVVNSVQYTTKLWTRVLTNPQQWRQTLPKQLKI